jgi:hypothetical protein
MSVVAKVEGDRYVGGNEEERDDDEVKKRWRYGEEGCEDRK